MREIDKQLFEDILRKYNKVAAEVGLRGMVIDGSPLNLSIYVPKAETKDGLGTALNTLSMESDDVIVITSGISNCEPASILKVSGLITNFDSTSESIAAILIGMTAAVTHIQTG